MKLFGHDMEIEFLGTGTSTGVPQIGCECRVCRSRDEHDKRFRASAIVRTKGKSILIDCGPDFRSQMLRASNHHLDALIVTHTHYDHVGGVDDLRPYCYHRTPFLHAAMCSTICIRRCLTASAKIPIPEHPFSTLLRLTTNPLTAVELRSPHCPYGMASC